MRLRANNRGQKELVRGFCIVIEIAIRLHPNNLLRSDPDGTPTEKVERAEQVDAYEPKHNMATGRGVQRADSC
jgi:hypothetical protein